MRTISTMPVYRAVIPRDLVARLPRNVFMGLVSVSIVMIGGLSQYWFVAVAIVAYITMTLLTKHDEYLIEISFSMLFEPDRLEV